MGLGRAARLLDSAGAAGICRRHAAAYRVDRLRRTRPTLRVGARAGDAAGVRGRPGASGRAGLDIRRAQGRRSQRHARSHAPPLARMAGDRSVRPRADAFGLRWAVGPQLRASGQYRSRLPRRSRRDRRGDAAVGPVCHRCASKAVLSGGDRRGASDSGRDIRRRRQRSCLVQSASAVSSPQMQRRARLLNSAASSP